MKWNSNLTQTEFIDPYQILFLSFSPLVSLHPGMCLTTLKESQQNFRLKTSNLEMIRESTNSINHIECGEIPGRKIENNTETHFLLPSYL